MAAALGMDTTAEGLETAEQYARPCAQGCGSIRGFLLSRPLSAGDALKLRHGRQPATRAA